MTAVQPRADAGYGDQPRFLDGLEDRRLPYVVGVPSIARFRIADEVERYPGDEPPPPYRGIGRPRKAKGLEARISATEARFILEGLEVWRVRPRSEFLEVRALVELLDTVRLGHSPRTCRAMAGGCSAFTS